MEKKFAHLQRIENDRTITKATDSEFLYHLQHGLLLALMERGTLNAMQYRQAAEKLDRQRRDRSGKPGQGGGDGG